MGLHIGYKCKCQQNLVLQPQMAAWSLGGLENRNVPLRPPCGLSMKLSYI